MDGLQQENHFPRRCDVLLATARGCDIHHFAPQRHLGQPQAAQRCIYVFLSDTIVKNVSGGVVANRNHELSQVTVCKTRRPGGKTRHNLAVFDQVFRIETVNVI